MKFKQNFRDISKPLDEVNNDELDIVLKELYGENKTFDVLKLVNALNKLTKTSAFTPLIEKIQSNQNNLANDLKELLELIYYKVVKNKVSTPERFKAEIAAATLDACPPGAYTNLQRINNAMNDSLYAYKYEYIQNLAAEFVRSLDIYSGNEVHEMNSLLHEVSEIYKLSVSEDIHAVKRDLSKNPTTDVEIKRFAFRSFVEDKLESRKGILNFAETVANSYIANLPFGHGVAKEFPRFVVEGEKTFASEQFVKVVAVCDSVNLDIESIIDSKADEESEDLSTEDFSKSTFKFKEGYEDIIKAACLKKMTDENFIEAEELSYEITTTVKIDAIRKLKINAENKIEKDEAGKPVFEIIPAREIEEKEKRIILESSDGWYEAKKVQDKISITRKLIDFRSLGNLTRGGSELFEYYRDEFKLKVTEANSAVIRSELNFNSFESVDNDIKSYYPDCNLADLDMRSKMILLSDQAQTLLKIFPAVVVVDFAKNKSFDIFNSANLAETKPIEFVKKLAKYASVKIYEDYILKNNMNLSSSDKYAIFKAAISNDNKALCDLFLQDDTYVFSKHRYPDGFEGSSMLLEAICMNKESMALSLLEKGISVLDENKGKSNAVEFACYKGGLKLFKAVYKRLEQEIGKNKAKTSNYRRNNKYGLLVIACSYGDIEKIKFLHE